MHLIDGPAGRRVKPGTVLPPVLLAQPVSHCGTNPVVSRPITAPSGSVAPVGLEYTIGAVTCAFP